MKSFQVTIEINASADQIWDVLVNVSDWPIWNSTVSKVVGTVQLGGKVTVHTTLSPGRAFPLRVSELVKPKSMVWTGGMPLGLFKGQRTYTLTPQSNGATKFEMVEVFSGLMAPLITKSIPDLQPSFEEFAACLKRVAEKV